MTGASGAALGPLPSVSPTLLPHTGAVAARGRCWNDGAACLRACAGAGGGDWRHGGGAAASAGRSPGGRAGHRGAVVPSTEDGAVCRLLSVVAVERKSVTGALEGAGDPRILVSETPCGDAEAARGDGTGAHDVSIVGGLLLELATVGGQVHANVELSEGNINAQVSEGLHVGCERRVRGDLADDKMALHTDGCEMLVLSAQGVPIHCVGETHHRS